MSALSLSEWQQRLEQRHRQEIQLGLDRMHRMVDQLELRDWDCPIILVGGTNGKGSTVHALRAIYQDAGYKTGLYTSPHLLHFNERIQFDGFPVDDAQICAAFAWIESQRHLPSEPIPLTYFETITLAFLLLMRAAKPDVIIMEVGLGGRLDATNVLDADLAIITTVDYDHQDYLGETLEAIGREKAGIFRPRQLAIYGDRRMPDTVAEMARTTHCHLHALGVDYDFELDAQGCMRFQQADFKLQLNKPLAIHPQSAAAAIAAVYLLHHRLAVNWQQLAASLPGLSVPGRLQRIQIDGKTVLFDVAHNPQAAAYLAEHLRCVYPGRQCHAVFGALKDKDIYGIIFALNGCVHHWYPAQLNSNRAIADGELLRIFTRFGVQPACWPSPEAAFKQALAQADAEDLIVVFGSFFTVAPVMAAQAQTRDRERRENETGAR